MAKSFMYQTFFTALCLFFLLPTPVLAQDQSHAEKPATQGSEAQVKLSASSTPQNALNITNDLVSIEGNWPLLGIKAIDDESKNFIHALAQAFENDAKEFAKDIANEMPKSELDLSHYFPQQLTISNEVLEASPRACSIVWNIWYYTGGAHGSLEIISNNYDKEKGVPLILDDLFEDPNMALLLFSQISRTELKNEFSEEYSNGPDGDSFWAEMIQSGTEPLAENFSVIALLPTGIRIFFPPYQVAPWSAGVPTVDISLEDLQKALPRLVYWGKK